MSNTSPSKEFVQRLSSAMSWLFFGSVFVSLTLQPLFFSSHGPQLFGLIACVVWCIGVWKVKSVCAREAQRLSPHQPYQAPAPLQASAPRVVSSVPEVGLYPQPPPSLVVPPPQKKAPPAPVRPPIDWETWIGRKLLPTVGILVVLIGMLVLLKYAFDNRWIDELGRLVLAALAGVGFLVGGGVARRKYPQWAAGFTGAGFTLFYLTVWAAHVFYASALQMRYDIDISPTLALFLYGAVTAVAILTAVRYNSRTVGWYALLGGYLTPMLLRAVEPNPVGFSAYLLVLAFGLLALSYYRGWRDLFVTPFVLTQLYLFGTVYELTDGPILASGIVPHITVLQQCSIAIAFFVLFSLIPLLRQFRLRLPATREDVWFAIFNTLAVFAPVTGALGGWESESISLVCLGLAVLCLLYAIAAIKLRAEDRLLVDAYLSGSIALVALTLLHQMGWHWVAAGFAPYGALLTFLAVFTRRKVIWRWGQSLLALSLFILVTNVPTTVSNEILWRPFTSDWAIASMIVGASLVAALLRMRSLPTELDPLPTQAYLRTLTHSILALIAFAVLTIEVTRLQPVFTLSLAYTYLAYIAFATILYAVTSTRPWLVAAIVSSFVVFLSTFFFANSSGMVLWSWSQSVPTPPIVHPWAAVSIFTALLMVALWFVTVRRMGLSMNVRAKLSIVAMLLAQLWLHVTVEIAHMAQTYEWTNASYHHALSIWWVFFALALLSRTAWPTLQRVGIALLFVPYLKDLFRILAGDAPTVDMLAWTVLLVALTVVAMHAKQRTIRTFFLWMLLILAGFDMLAHMGETDGGLLRTVWWAGTALVTMIAGFIERDALPRRMAIAIFAATVFKLLVVDFSAFSAPVRIGASIATGLLMIGASYLYQRFSSEQK